MQSLQPGQEQINRAPLVLGCLGVGITVTVASFWIQSAVLLPQGFWQALWSLVFPPVLDPTACFSALCPMPSDPETTRGLMLWILGSSALLGFVGAGLAWIPLNRWLEQDLERRKQGRQIRGARLQSPQNNKENRLDSTLPIEIGGVRFPKHLETLSLLTCGSPGTGKTTNINQILQVIRQRPNNKSILYDGNGDYLKIFYRPGDIVLGFSPWSTHTWSPWREYPQGFGFENVAEVLIPESGTDTFWSDSARTILTALLELTQSWAELQRLVYHGKIEELVKLTEKTEAHRLLSSKEATSILTGMASRLSFLRYLQDPSVANGLQAFNFREWAVDPTDSRWVFLVVPDAWKKIAKPIITVYLDVICSATFQRPVDPLGSERLWLVIDELASLSCLPRLEDFLAQGRKYGGCAILGFQLISQLRKIYGLEGTNSILGCCQSKLILRTADGETCKFLADLIGQREYYEPVVSMNEELSFEGKRSKSQSYQKKIDYLILPSQISNLPTFHGLLVMPEQGVHQILTDPSWGRSIAPELPLERPVFTSQRSQELLPSPSSQAELAAGQPRVDAAPDQEFKQPKAPQIKTRTKRSNRST